MNTLASYTHLTDGELERWCYDIPGDAGARSELLQRAMTRAMTRGFHPEEDIEAVIANAEEDHSNLAAAEERVKDLEEECDAKDTELKDADKRIDELEKIIEEASLDLV